MCWVLEFLPTGHRINKIKEVVRYLLMELTGITDVFRKTEKKDCDKLRQ